MITSKKSCRKVVPDEFMIPLGAKMTKELGTCADSWSDSDIKFYIPQLPQQYHIAPVDAFRRQMINLRKRGTPGFRLNGKGPSVESKVKKKRKPPKQYQDYLDSDDWKNRRLSWIEYWKSCCICNGVYRLDVHHRTYERLGKEDFKDCVVLCRHCHDLFHQNDGMPKKEELIGLFKELGINKSQTTNNLS